MDVNVGINVGCPAFLVQSFFSFSQVMHSTGGFLTWSGLNNEGIGGKRGLTCPLSQGANDSPYHKMMERMVEASTRCAAFIKTIYKATRRSPHLYFFQFSLVLSLCDSLL